ncbi:MAG: alanine racemase, partial [Candidatus Aminicenantaceae bacterium]
ISNFRSLIGKKLKLMGVVKANAYGHGILEISELALKAGVDWLGIHSLGEGFLLRKQGFDCPLLILGYIPLEDLEEAVVNNFRITVYNLETVHRLARLCSRLKKRIYLHLKIETGTYRQGIREEDIFQFIKEIQRVPDFIIEGLSSHFANIEDTTDHTYFRFQLENFIRIIQKLRVNKIEIPLKHIACTAATILFPETYFDMVRVGIGMYGLWPSKETYLSCILQKRKPLSLKPVLAWKARIAQIKKVPKGAYLGYGCTYRTTRESNLAVIPVGYFDGYSRCLSNSSYVLIRGHRAPLRGRVCMDFILVDITDIPGISLEDEAVLLGCDGDEIISAEDLAVLAGTINYEIVTRINPLIPRIVV